jgi:hypothetical protein
VCVKKNQKIIFDIFEIRPLHFTNCFMEIKTSVFGETKTEDEQNAKGLRISNSISYSLYLKISHGSKILKTTIHKKILNNLATIKNDL